MPLRFVARDRQRKSQRPTGRKNDCIEEGKRLETTRHQPTGTGLHEIALRVRAGWKIATYRPPPPVVRGIASHQQGVTADRDAERTEVGSTARPRRGWALLVEIIGWLALALLVAAPWVLLLTD